MPHFLPGLCSVTFRHLDPTTVIDIAREAGLRAVEWGGDNHVPINLADIVRQVRNATEAAGLAPASYGSYLDPVRANVSEFASTLATTQALGACNLRLWAGTRGRPSSDYTAAERSHAANAIRAISEAALLAGIAISLEHHPQTLTDCTESAERLFDEISHSNTYLCWQPRPGLPIREALAEIARLGSHISHLHVFAWDKDGFRFPLDDAEGFWREVLQTIPEGRFLRQRYAFLEFVAGDKPARLKHDAAVLLRILANVERLWSHPLSLPITLGLIKGVSHEACELSQARPPVFWRADEKRPRHVGGPVAGH